MPAGRDLSRLLQGAGLVLSELGAHAPEARSRLSELAGHAAAMAKLAPEVAQAFAAARAAPAAAAEPVPAPPAPAAPPADPMAALLRPAVPPAAAAAAAAADEPEPEEEAPPRPQLTQASVPSSPLARVLGFGSLAAGLAVGTVRETVRRQMDGGAGGAGSAVMNEENADRLAEALCKMRGAALKLGQMLSIQDERTLPPALSRALDRVRAQANVMPPAQMESVMAGELGADWRSLLESFEEEPIAAASIGQVHRGELPGGRGPVALKVQYPGVAESIDSDLLNLKRLVTFTNVLPKGLYIDEIIRVGKEELTVECDYEREAANQERFRRLVAGEPALAAHVNVPRVVPELSARRVLASEFCHGVPLDRLGGLSQDERNHIGRLVLTVALSELFRWRFMQTDPNWGNFLYERRRGVLHLIDYGAAREYPDEFIDRYLQLVWAAADGDSDTILRVSRQMGFLTGDESPAMEAAHCATGLVVGRPFATNEPFDFGQANLSQDISPHGQTFLKARLTPPPREAYSLQRKLGGAFLTCTKLGAVVRCREILEAVDPSSPSS